MGHLYAIRVLHKLQNTVPFRPQVQSRVTSEPSRLPEEAWSDRPPFWRQVADLAVISSVRLQNHHQLLGPLREAIHLSESVQTGNSQQSYEHPDMTWEGGLEANPYELEVI